MGKTKYYKIKYNDKRLILGYCEYVNFEWCCVKINGCVILTINNKYSSKYKSKIIHKVLSRAF